MSFQLKAIRFVSYNIPIFDEKNLNMKEDGAVVMSSENFKITTCVPLKNVLTEHQVLELHLEL